MSPISFWCPPLKVLPIDCMKLSGGGPSTFRLWRPTGPLLHPDLPPFEQLPNNCHAKQRNQDRHTEGMNYGWRTPFPQTDTSHLNPVSTPCLLPAVTHFSCFVLRPILIPCLVCVRSACLGFPCRGAA